MLVAFAATHIFARKIPMYLKTVNKFVREIYFFKVRELSGNSVMCQGKKELCKNVRQM